MVHLLDVNVLLALAWPNHVHHQPAHAWFESASASGWATCPMTQAAFVRLSCQPAVTGLLIPFAEAVQILEASTRSPHHQFWHHDTAISALLPELAARVMGPKQLTDAALLDLAIRHEGALATFDKRIANLLPAGSNRLSHLTVIPV